MDKKSIVWGSFFLSLVISLVIVFVVIFRAVDAGREFEEFENTSGVVDSESGAVFGTESVDEQRFIKVDEYVPTDVAQQQADSYEDSDGISWKRYFFDDGISMMMPGQCFVFSLDGDRMSLEDQSTILRDGVDTVWIDCLHDDAHFLTLGLSRKAMDGFQEQKDIGIYQFDAGIIRIRENFYFLYHLGFGEDNHFALYVDEESFGSRMLETLLVPENLIVDPIESGVQSHDRYELAVPSKLARAGRSLQEEHKGTIRIRDAHLLVENMVLQGGNIVFDMQSLAVSQLENEGMTQILNDHLKGGDFFAVSQYPVASFSVFSGVVLTGSVSVDGELTMKSISAPLSIDMEVRYDDTTMRTRGSFVFNRMKRGVDGMQGVVDDFIGVAFDLVWIEVE